ncbi:MAG TPA: hypothetical protein VFR23_15720 [Jiangellaceae bacterium]|nr:hypothetical protein [Jiangellaceae bacterium]
MAETTKPTEARKPEPVHKPEPESKASPAAKNLAPAGESGDPVVHKLLAERQGHMQNAEPDPDREAVRKAAREAVDEIDKKLADLGYTAQ